ncbi:MAG: hypothetical protein RLY40_1328 [Pseudomonadota bacterium]|jgi:hypothetical protein
MPFKKIYRSVFLISGIMLLAGILLLNFIYPLTLGKTNILYSDYGKFYHSQQLFIQGKNIYTPIYFVKNKRNTGTHSSNHQSKHSKVLKLGGNLNPPFFTLISFPLAYLSYPHALLMWTLLSILAGALGILLLQQKLDAQAFSISCAVLVLIGLFSYYPSFVNLQFGQVSLLLLPLLVCGWRAARQEKIVSTAIWLALASSIKPFIGLFLFYFLMRKEWRGLAAFLLTLCSCALIAGLFLGFDSYIAYYHACQQIKWAASNWNVSIYGFLLRLFGGNESNVALLPVSGLVTYLYPLLAGIFFIALLQFLQATLKIPAQQKIDLDFSVIITAMLLLSPLGWLYYFPLLSIPVLILWQWAKVGIYPSLLPIVLMICIFFSNIPISLLGSQQIHTSNVLRVFLNSSLYFLVLIGLTSLLFLLRYHLAVNTNKASRAKNNDSAKRIPTGLLLLMGIVAFLPSYQGMSKATIDWLRHSTHYSQQYSFVAHHQE